MSSRRIAVISFASLLISCLIGLRFGAAESSFGDLVGFVGSQIGLADPLDEPLNSIFGQLRSPRVVLGALVGASLASAGASYQGVFRNDLADPYLLGVSAGAGLGATVIFTSFSDPVQLGVGAAAFLGALAAVSVVGLVAKAAGGGSANLLLAGIAVAAFVSSFQVLLISRSRESSDEVFFWVLGGLVTSGWREVFALALVSLPCLVLLAWLARGLDVLSIGEADALSLGMDVSRFRSVVIVVATLLTACAVSVAGLIGFIGLVIPHMVRLIFGNSFRQSVWLSAVWGATFLVLADLLARSALDTPIPVGIITSAVGGPFFAFILIRSSASRGLS